MSITTRNCEKLFWGCIYINKKIPKIAEECLYRWGKEDDNTKNLSNKIDKFISQLGDDQKNGEILLTLLKKYNYYSRQKVEEILKSFYDEIKKLELPKSRTIYSRIEDNSKINSSNNLLEEFKIINDISNNYSHDISKIDLDKFEEIDYIIFIDDIIGTGDTVKNFIKSNKEKFKRVKSRIFCIECMEKAKNKIERYLEEEEIECIIMPYNLSPKAFKDNNDFENAMEARRSLYNFEKILANGDNRFILGYKESEALVSFYRNTPNNTISSYWNPYNGWKPLFQRNLDKPDFMNDRIHKKKSSKFNIPYNLEKKLKKKKGES